jgi:hypothetical protein
MLWLVAADSLAATYSPVDPLAIAMSRQTRNKRKTNHEEQIEPGMRHGTSLPHDRELEAKPNSTSPPRTSHRQERETSDLLNRVRTTQKGQTIAHLLLRRKSRNRLGDFVEQITKPQLVVLRPKPKKPSSLVLRLNQETCAPHLFVHDADRTRHHPTSRSSGHQVPDQCLTISCPLHQVSYSYLNTRHCLTYRTCHLHTTRQANMFLHMTQTIW